MYLLDFHENILVRRKLSVEPEQLLLLLAHRLHTERSARTPRCPRAVEQAARRHALDALDTKRRTSILTLFRWAGCIVERGATLA